MERPDETISVTAEVATLLREVVEADGYASASDAIRDALLARSQDVDLGGYTPEEISRLADEGIASGPAEPIDFEAVKREIRDGVGAPASET